MSSSRCPICNRPVKSPTAGVPGDKQGREGAISFFPFCSERCKLIDLGNWLGDRYRVTSPAPFAEDENRSPEDDSE